MKKESRTIRVKQLDVQKAKFSITGLLLLWSFKYGKIESLNSEPKI
jgi:hypothetical protein